MQIVRLLLSLLGGVGLTCAHAQKHPFNVRDDIEMWRFSSPHSEPSDPATSVAKTSPDGRYAAIVTTCGVLKTDLVESRITVFDLREVAGFLHKPGTEPPTARVIASVSSYPHHVETEAYAPVIKDLLWSPDGRTLFFRIENMEGNFQLCMAQVDRSNFHCLTPASETVDHFDLLKDKIVFSAGDPGVHLVDPGRRINRDAVDVTGARLQEVLFPNEVAAHSAALYRLYVLDLTNPRHPIRAVPKYTLLNIPFLSAVYPFKASPDGQSLIDLEPVASVPESWTHYATAPGAEHLRLTGNNDARLFRADNILRPLQYTLIDLKTGKMTPLLNAPNARSLGFTGDRNQIAWSEDGKHVVVTNTFLSESEVQVPCDAAVVDLKTLNSDCLYLEDGSRTSSVPRLHDAVFGKNGREVTLSFRRAGGEQSVRTYTFQSDRWRLVSTATAKPPADRAFDPVKFPVVVFVHEGLNDPPTLWASDSAGKRELWNPNPQLGAMQFGEASPYTWKDRVGRDWSGILVKPIDYRPGVRYPLIIQLYSFNPDQFLTDGLYPTAFAAREMADAGFMVLQIKKRQDTVSEADPQIHLDAYISAVDTLADADLIDRTKVGVVGFSLSCWYVVNALIKKPDLFKAATIADGIDYSYMQYMLFAAEFYPLQKQMDQVRGGSPIGAGLHNWLDVASGFNLDRVRTPVRIEAIGPSSVLQEWELYSSLRLQGKAVDLIYLPEGTHIHQRPLERLESQQGDIEWFRFWLQGSKDPDPSKREQYQQWESMAGSCPQ